MTGDFGGGKRGGFWGFTKRELVGSFLRKAKKAVVGRCNGLGCNGLGQPASFRSLGWRCFKRRCGCGNSKAVPPLRFAGALRERKKRGCRMVQWTGTASEFPQLGLALFKRRCGCGNSQAVPSLRFAGRVERRGKKGLSDGAMDWDSPRVSAAWVGVV